MKKLLAVLTMKPARLFHSGGRAPLCFIALLTFNFQLSTLFAQTGIINTIAGTAGVGYLGNGGAATAAYLNQDGGVAIDASGNIYIADSYNNVIRLVNTSGIIYTVAGNGYLAGNPNGGYSGNGGPATAAELADPIGVSVDSLGNIYFSDAGNALIRMVNTSGIIHTIAGIPGIGGYSGNGGQATACELNYPVGICLDKILNVYIADQNNNVIRKINASTGVITTVAGRGPAFAGFSGNGNPATAAELDSPTGVAIDNSGNMYIADLNNNVVRVVNSSGIINAFAGNGMANFNGFSGQADTTELDGPTGVSTDVAGNVYIADAGNNVVREVVPGGQMYVIAGNSVPGYGGDRGYATLAQLNYPFDMVTDNNHDVFIADLLNNRVREITASCVTSANLAAYNYPECYGDTDGIAVAFPASPFAPYSYSWSAGTISANGDTANSLPAGTYTVSVTDAMGCTGTGSIVITQPSQIIISFTPVDDSICAGSQITMTANATGGAGGYTYDWNFGNGDSTNTLNDTPGSNTTYTIYVTDSTGCTNSASYTAVVNPLPNAILNAETYSMCVANEAPDTLFGVPPGGTYGGNYLTGNVFIPPVVTSDTTFDFTYTYTDSAGCTGVATQSVIVNTCTGIKTLSDNSRISVYPNPASGQFTVDLQTADAAQLIALYSITGQQVYEHEYATAQNSQLTIINTSQFPDGIYLLKVVLTDGTTLLQKVDIVR